VQETNSDKLKMILFPYPCSREVAKCHHRKHSKHMQCFRHSPLLYISKK